MPTPYVLTTLLFGALATLAALDTALVSLGLAPLFNGPRWLRVHLVTLGMLAESLFGLLPLLVAARSGRPRPRVRRDIWLALNAGLVILLVGIPRVNGSLILVGGGLVFAAAGLLALQLRALGGGPGRVDVAGPSGRPFYLAGLAFLLVGIVIGTGLWNEWARPPRIAIPLEAHIHANAFGFLALTFAGLLIDLYPGFAGCPLAWPRSTRPILWLMIGGAFVLVLSPWTGRMMLMLPGVLLHLLGTAWLVTNAVRPALGRRRVWTAGFLHLTTGYLWYLAPIVVAPLVISGRVGASAGAIEQSAPQALIFGWAAQLAYALIPCLLWKSLLPDRPPALGGTPASLAAANLGAVAIWASMLVEPLQASLYGLAYLFWVAALVLIVVQCWRIVQAAPRPLEAEPSAGRGAPVDPA
ncbi:MAG: hypothetical protein IT307_04850 [Chloroflexi bacterium]|nr:hypothetical protein [Chloroflexota bacterium]